MMDLAAIFLITELEIGTVVFNGCFTTPAFTSEK
jgi:hypothetical protein